MLKQEDEFSNFSGKFIKCARLQAFCNRRKGIIAAGLFQLTRSHRSSRVLRTLRGSRVESVERLKRASVLVS